MTSSNYIRTEGSGRLRCYRAPAVASRQLEASIGTLVVMLMLGFVAVVSQHGPSKPPVLAAELQARKPAIVHASVRVIPMSAPLSATLVSINSGNL